MNKSTIIWVEDDPSSVMELTEYCEGKGYKIVMSVQPHKVADDISDHIDDIAFIVIDVMLKGVDDLTSVGIHDANTNSGLNAGMVFTNRLLRGEDEVDFPDVKHVPIILLTSKKPDKEDEAKISDINTRSSNSAKVYYIEKRDMDKEMRFVAKEKFINLVNSFGDPL